jgi:NTP pyrophosphatase (non-canonical NTP hydrolase)
MELKRLQDELAAAAAERNLGPQQNPKNLAMAVAADAGALLALFRWLSDEQSWRVGGEPGKRAAAEALADLITHALRLADELGVDVEAGILERLPPLAEPTRPAPATPQTTAPPAKPVPAAAPPAPPAPPRAEPPAVAVAAPSPAVEAPVAAPPPAPKRERKAPAPETPPWLDGLLRPTPGRPMREAPPPVAPMVPPAPAEPVIAAPEEIAAVPALDATGSIEGLTEAAEAAASPAHPAPRPRPAELDADAAKALVRSLGKRLGAARSDDPLLRELHDELETLRRTLYSPSPKPSWVAESLHTIRAMLEEAAQHQVGAEIRAGEHLAQVGRILGD